MNKAVDALLGTLKAVYDLLDILLSTIRVAHLLSSCDFHAWIV